MKKIPVHEFQIRIDNLKEIMKEDGTDIFLIYGDLTFPPKTSPIIMSVIPTYLQLNDLEQ